MTVATNLQLLVTTIILTGVISLAHATVSVTSNSGGAAACPGQELVLTCVAENTIALRWRVFSSLHDSSFIEKAYTRSSTLGVQDIEEVFVFTLVSNANKHFESLLITVAMQSLHNTVIECHSASVITSFTIKIESKNRLNLALALSNGTQNFCISDMHSKLNLISWATYPDKMSLVFSSTLSVDLLGPSRVLLIQLHVNQIGSSLSSDSIACIEYLGVPQNPTNISSMVDEYLSISSTVEITWNHDPLVDYYHYELIDGLNGLVRTLGNTSNTSTIIEDQPYNHNVLFTLSAINCAGRSSPIAYHINIVGCLNIKSSSLQMNSNFSQAPGTKLSLSCVYNSSIQIIITCQDDGRWEPNPLSFSALCDINDVGLLNEVAENSLIPNMTYGTIQVADDNESFDGSFYIHRYIIISASASLSFIVASAGVLVMIVMCINQVRKRRMEAVCSNMERHYETVNEPIYEMVLNVNPNTEGLSDCNTKYNEAYQKTGISLHLYSELFEQ